MIDDELVISVSVLHYLLCSSGSRHLLPQSSSRNSRIKCQICFKSTLIEQRQLVVLVSFFGNFQEIPHLMLAFLLWTFNRRLGMYGMWNSKSLDFTIYRLLRIFFNRSLYHTETSQVICNSMQINWMVLIDINQKRAGLFLRLNRLRGPLDSSP